MRERKATHELGASEVDSRDEIMIFILHVSRRVFSASFSLFFYLSDHINFLIRCDSLFAQVDSPFSLPLALTDRRDKLCFLSR